MIFSVVFNWRRIDLVHQVIIIQILLSQWLLQFFICPFQSERSLIFEARTKIKLSQRSHLRVQICVPDNEFLIFDLYVVVAQFSPPLSLRAQPAQMQLILVLRQLAEEARAHLEILPPAVDKFEGLQDTPAVATHQKGRDHETSSVLGTHRLNQD